jgi:ubiquinone/menaquinone biosynthesis C-methylase UbiE
MNTQISDYIKTLVTENGIHFQEPLPHLEGKEQLYLRIRQKENRIFSDNELAQLPYLSDHRHSEEWKKRSRSSERLSGYLNAMNIDTVLDLGCGNGWFTNMLVKNGRLVIGLDKNRTELQQAASVFRKENLRFVFGDIFSMKWPEETLDIVTIGAAIQYFEDFGKIMNRLSQLLKPNGEIHIFDSPFYPETDIASAKQRSKDYYHSLGFPEMANFYFHHSTKSLVQHNAQFLYRPSERRVLPKLFGKKDSPFPWVKIEKS